MNRLVGKYVLITGGSQGLGRELTINFIKEGAAGISIVARTQEYLDKVHNTLVEINQDQSHHCCSRFKQTR